MRMLVSDDKKLRIFIVKLTHEAYKRLDEEGWQHWLTLQDLHWYTPHGEDLGKYRDQLVNKKLNFLNPDRETLLQFWKANGDSDDIYTDNQGMAKCTKYSRFAIAAWPAALHLENALNLMSVELAVEELVSRQPVDAATLRTFLDKASSKYGWTHRDKNPISARFYRTFCDLLLDANDTELIKLFFTKFCPPLDCVDGNQTLVPVLTKTVRSVAWSEIGEAMLDVLSNRKVLFNFRGDECVSGMELLLLVAAGLEKGESQQALVNEATMKVDKLFEFELRSAKAVDIFWKHAIRPGDKQLFDMVTSKLLLMDPRKLGSFVEGFSLYLSDSTDEQLDVLAKVSANREQWLKREIAKLEKVGKAFTWNMPYAKFDKHKEIEVFLRGPKQSMTTEEMPLCSGRLIKFPVFTEARDFAFVHNYGSQNEASFMAKAGEENEVLSVTITKTRKWFEEAPIRLAQYNEELARLSKIRDGNPSKKARLD